MSRPRPARLARAAGRDQQLLAGDRAAVGERDGELGAVVRRPASPCAGRASSRRRAAERRRDQLGRLRLLDREQPVLRLDHRDRDAEPREDLGQFHADRTAAEHEQRRRQRRDLDRLVVGPERRAGQPVDRRDRRRTCRRPARRPGGRRWSRRRPRPCFGPTSRAGAADEAAALAGEPVDRDLVVPVVGGLVPDPRGDRRPVRRRRSRARPARRPGAPRRAGWPPGSSSCSARTPSTGTRRRPAAARSRPRRGPASASLPATSSPPTPSPTTTTSTISHQRTP